MKLVFTVSNQKLSSLRNSQAGKKKKSQSAEKFADFWNRLHGSKTHFDSRLRLIQADLTTFAWYLGDIIAWYANWVKSFQFNIRICVFCPRDYTLDFEATVYSFHKYYTVPAPPKAIPAKFFRHKEAKHFLPCFNFNQKVAVSNN